MKKDNHTKGREGERLARIYLEKLGYVFVEANYVCDMGEIDLIMSDKEWLVFVEVKFKKSDVNGLPEEMINKSKISRIVRSAMMYLLEKRKYKEIYEKYRIDAVCILGDKINHYVNLYE